MVGHAGSPRGIVRADMTLTQGQGYWAFELPENCRKLHFSRSISSAILAWSSKLIVDRDSIGPSLQPDFPISF